LDWGTERNGLLLVSRYFLGWWLAFFFAYVVIFSDFLEIPSEKLGRRSWTVHPVQQLLCVLMPLVSMNQQSAKTKEEEGLL
jgi:hypothetical protein